MLFFFFFFQAEDGIRDGHVTGVQTCALPISGLFVKQGRLKIWLTDDARRIPVRMRSKVAIGSVSADLEAYTPASPAPREPALPGPARPGSGASPCPASRRAGDPRLIF